MRQTTYWFKTRKIFLNFKVKSMWFQSHDRWKLVKPTMCYADGTNGILIRNKKEFSQGQLEAISRSSDFGIGLCWRQKKEHLGWQKTAIIRKDLKLKDYFTISIRDLDDFHENLVIWIFMEYTAGDLNTNAHSHFSRMTPILDMLEIKQI